MIPKIIHYCWFGGNPLPEEAMKCIESWQKYCPDYEIVEWNEKNFPFEKFQYANEALKEKKYAFVSDVARLYALVNYGGVYMDTDVEVLKPIDNFLELEAFSGFENDRNIPTGIMGCKPQQSFFQLLLNQYNGQSFYNNDGSLNLTTNVTYITKLAKEYGLIMNGKKQTIKGFTLFPRDYFCPLSHETGELNITENTYTIHWFAGSWKSKEEKLLHERAKHLATIVPLFGKQISFVYEKIGKVFMILKSGNYKELIGRTKNYIEKRRNLK